MHPARCKDCAVFCGGSNTSTCDTFGSKSSPRARSDVLGNTCGSSPSASALLSLPVKAAARCLLDPCERPPWPVTTTFGGPCCERYAPILPARERVLVNKMMREPVRPPTRLSRQTVFIFAITSPSRLPKVQVANSSVRCVGRRCRRGETSRVVCG